MLNSSEKAADVYEVFVHCSFAGQHFSQATFRNPYDKGVIGNVKEFLN